MEKMIFTSSFTSSFSTTLATDFTTGFPTRFTNEMGFIDEIACAPTPPTSPMDLFMDEYDDVHIPIENLLGLSKIMGVQKVVM